MIKRSREGSSRSSSISTIRPEGGELARFDVDRKARPGSSSSFCGLDDPEPDGSSRTSKLKSSGKGRSSYPSSTHSGAFSLPLMLCPNSGISGRIALALPVDLVVLGMASMSSLSSARLRLVRGETGDGDQPLFGGSACGVLGNGDGGVSE